MACSNNRLVAAAKPCSGDLGLGGGGLLNAFYAYSILSMVQMRMQVRCHTGRAGLGTALHLLFLQLVNLLAGIWYAGQQQLHCCDIIYNSRRTASRCGLGGLQQLHDCAGRQAAYHLCQTLQHRCPGCLRTLQHTSSLIIDLLSV